MSVLSTLFCVVVLLGVSSIHAHVISPFRHLTGITLDRVTDVTFPPATEAPTPSPTPKPKKTFVIDVDDVHGHVVPTTEVPVKKKRKRPDLHAWSKDNKDKTEIDPKIINQFIAAASTPDELTDGQPAVKIVKLKDTKGRTRAPPTEPPTSPPTKPATKLRVEPPAESSTESQEEAAHEEEVEEESRLKRMRKTNRAKGQESVRDYEKEHQHEDEKPRREEETMSHENHRDTARDQHETTHDNERHDDTHDTDDDTRKRSSSSDTTHTSSASDTEVHSAIPFEPVDEHIKEVLHWKENNKESTKKQWTWEKENKDERKKQKDDAAHDETQTSTSKKKRKEDTDDHSHDHIERRSRQDDDTHDETPRRTRKDETDTHGQHDETSRKTRHDEDDHDKPKSKATWEWKDEKNPTKKEDDKKVASKPTTPKAKATPVPKTGHDAVDRLVANMAADFAAHLEAEKAAGHDVTHLTVGDTKSSSKSDKPYVPPIHHDNLAHHDYVDPDKVQFADSIVKWHAPAAPPAIKVVDETAIEREADGSVHLRGAKPPAEGGPAGIDLALP